MDNEKYKQDLILLGKHIKKLREERDLTLKDLAKKSGIRAKYLEKIENGTAIRISIFKHLLRLAKALKIKFHEIFDFNKTTR